MIDTLSNSVAPCQGKGGKRRRRSGCVEWTGVEGERRVLDTVWSVLWKVTRMLVCGTSVVGMRRVTLHADALWQTHYCIAD